jgi:hypothetical protein
MNEWQGGAWLAQCCPSEGTGHGLQADIDSWPQEFIFSPTCGQWLLQLR